MQSARLIPDSLWELFNALEEGIVCMDGAGAVLGWNKPAAGFFIEDRGASRMNLRLEDLLEVREPEGLHELARASDGLFQRTLVVRSGEVPAWLIIRPLRQVGPQDLRVLVLRRRSIGAPERGASSIIAFYSLLIHEVKNPLAAIKVLIQGVDLELSVQAGTEAIRSVLNSYLSRVNREIERIVKLLDSVKYLSRLSMDRRAPYDLVKVVRSVLAHCAPAIERRRVRYQLVTEAESCELYGDPDELRQVLLNLIEHALEAMTEDGGRLEVVLRPEGEGVELSVSDTGAGMSEEALSRLYHQSDPFRSGGLALSVARWIVDRNRGRVSFISQKGSGTTVKIWLPLAGAVEHQEG